MLPLEYEDMFRNCKYFDGSLDKLFLFSSFFIIIFFSSPKNLVNEYIFIFYKLAIYSYVLHPEVSLYLENLIKLFHFFFLSSEWSIKSSYKENPRDCKRLDYMK